jgi:predicted adenylyl cyclase CyaB
VERRLAALGARLAWTRRQRDTFFTAARGWLKLRETDGAPAELISYVRPTDDADPRPSEYDVVRLEDPTAMMRLLGRALPVDGIVEKERTLWLLDHTRVHLDRVEGLGEFVELETVVEDISADEAGREARSVVEALGLDRASFLAVPYRDLLRAERTPDRPVLLGPRLDGAAPPGPLLDNAVREVE